jgi:GH24 family phage-related lysozyme (muramidase)
MNRLIISQRVVDFIIQEEVGSPAEYGQIYEHPTWPKGDSGITIGLGYDLGYNSPGQIAADWKLKISAEMITALVRVANLKGDNASRALTPQIKSLRIPYDAAEAVFTERVLPRYAEMAVRAFPALTALLPDAAGAIVSLVFNRGTRLKDSGTKEAKELARAEMRKIAGAIPSKDYPAIIEALISMKRLWDGVPDFVGDVEQKFGGLLRRRDGEAALVRGAVRQYSNTELRIISY